MVFRKGEVSNPLGWVAQQQFTTELRRQLQVAHAIHKRPKLEVIAQTLADKACDGEAWAINMVAERIDGKPLQSVVSASVDATSLFVDVLKRISEGHFRDDNAGENGANSVKTIEHHETKD